MQFKWPLPWTWLLFVIIAFPSSTSITRTYFKKRWSLSAGVFFNCRERGCFESESHERERTLHRHNSRIRSQTVCPRSKAPCPSTSGVPRDSDLQSRRRRRARPCWRPLYRCPASSRSMTETLRNSPYGRCSQYPLRHPTTRHLMKSYLMHETQFNNI